VEAFRWDAERDPVPAEALHGVDAVVGLVGEGIAEGRWTSARKERLRESRVAGTRRVVEGMRRAGVAPRVFVSSSAIGWYGTPDRGDEPLTEQSPAGQGFLAELCRDWEAAARNGLPEATRLVSLRTGLVLGPGGGPLERMLPVFRVGLGGKLGSGRQGMSWIHVEDLVSLILFALGDERVRGPLNGVAPHPVSNAEFVKTLGTVLGKPAVLPAPAFALKLALGEMSEIVLEGAYIHPARAVELGFHFRYPKLQPALEACLEKKSEKGELLLREQWIPRPLETVFPFFADERNLERLTPGWLGFEIVGKSSPELREGTLIDYRLRLHGIPLRWRSRIESWRPGQSFVDTQVRGPYRLWHHTHRFESLAGGTLVTDRVRYRLPGGSLGRLLLGRKVGKDLEKIFDFRRQTLDQEFGTGAGAGAGK
jgi:uncharacterized protein (TIGR01777 family)